MDRLKGKVAIVTGAGRLGNIGLAVCEAFLREGAKVLATDIRAENEAAVREQMSAFGDDVFAFAQHDATSEEDWRRIAELVITTFGQLDVLVNNAGIALAGGVANTTLESLRSSMAINHDSIFLGTQICAPLLESAVTRFPGGGAIVNTISMASYSPDTFHVGYSVSKAAARMLTMVSAQEYGRYKIRVNSVHPGMTMTPMLREGFEHYIAAGHWTSMEEATQSLAALSPLNTGSAPEDTAHAFVYLASDEARFVTGAALYHDGGFGKHY